VSASERVISGLTDEEVRELGFESTPKGWVPLEAAEEHRRTGMTAKQWRRFSFVTVRGQEALPDAGYKTFILASSLGKMMNRDGTFDRIKNADDALCVVVRLATRNHVLALIGSDSEPKSIERNWRNHVVEWIKVGMAHRCKGQPRGTVTLFFEPQQVCPVCTRTEPEFRTNGNLVPPCGTSIPQSVPIPGVAIRDGEGDAGSEPWILKKKEMLEQLKNLDGYKEELAAKEAKEDE
jgi:hypothetical protein